jgi:hypothetical protein
MAPLQFCTTSSRRYLPYARSLALSIRRAYPEATLWVLLTDDHHHEVDAAAEPFASVWNEELGIEPAELHRRFLIHADDFHIAIKPWIVEHILDRTGGPVMFIDSDIRLYGPLDDVAGLIDEHGVVLTPHVRAPMPLDGLRPNDTIILGAGIYNAGMVGVGAGGRAFLEFWKSRLRRECYIDIPAMRVGEQRWLDFVPSIVPCLVLRDPSINVAYWNLHERPLSIYDGVVFAGEAPLRAFHFSGHDLDRPNLISRHMDELARFNMASQPIVAELCAEYRQGILAAGYEAARAIPVDFAALPSGIPISKELRDIFRDAVVAADSGDVPYPPDPYDVRVVDAFCAWAREAYAARSMPIPAWTVAVGMPSATIAEPPAVPEPSLSEVEELVAQFATSSSTALTNLDQRIRALEAQLISPR